MSSRISYRRRLKFPRSRYRYIPPSSDEEDAFNVQAAGAREAAEPTVNQMMKILHNDRGKYTTDEDEDVVPEVMKPPQLEVKKTEEKVVLPRRRRLPSGRGRVKIFNFGARESDGGMYTTDEEESLRSPILARRKGKEERKKEERNTSYQQIQKRFRFLLLMAVTRKEPGRFEIYGRLNLFPPAQLSIRRVEDTVSCLLDVVARMPAFSFYCAEYLHRQMISLSPSDQRLFRSAVTRRILGRFMGEGYYWMPLNGRRNLKFIYSTLFAYLYLVEIVPTKVLKRTINRLFQTNNFETHRMAVFDTDSVVYIARILKIVGLKFDTAGRGQQKLMDKWWTHLGRMGGDPSVVLADVRSLQALRMEGSWYLEAQGRLDDFECHLAGDDVAFRTNNSYGRKLFCSREILSLYSPFFLALFSSRRGCSKLVDLTIDVEYYLLREVLNVIYHVNRDFTDEDLGYDLPLLMELFSFAENFDFPLIRRLVSEQLEEEAPMKVAQVAYRRGFSDITSQALRRMEEEEVETFMMTCHMQGQMKTQDIVTILEKLWPPFFRVSRNQNNTFEAEEEPQEEEEDEDMMFPSDFGSEWPLYDVAIQCHDAGDRVLYANGTMLATFSNTFRRFMDFNRPKNGMPIRVSLNLNYNAVKAILRIIHHVNRRFGRLMCPNVSPWMIGQVMEAGYRLEMPLVLKMMDDVLTDYSRERLLQTALIEHVPHSDLAPGRHEDGPLAQLIHQAVIKKVEA